MPRERRPENRGLPARWRFLHGAYYYEVPPTQVAAWGGKRLFRLGKTLPEAHREWAARLDVFAGATTIGELLDRYSLEEVPKKGPKAQREQPRQIARLKAAFGRMPIAGFKLVYAYQYQDRRKKTPTAAKRELEILSHAFTKAATWGYTDVNPFRTAKFEKAPYVPRDRYVEDAEVEAALAYALQMRQERLGRMLHAYIRLKLLTGRRRSEILRLSADDLTDDGVRFTLTKTKRKTGIRTIITPWSDALRAAVNDAKAARPVDIARWLFCTRKGKPYITEDAKTRAFDSLWQRFMRGMVKAKVLKQGFHEHDLRAKAGTDVGSIERAQKLLQHADQRTTNTIYRRKPEIVEPTG